MYQEMMESYQQQGDLLQRRRKKLNEQLRQQTLTYMDRKNLERRRRFLSEEIAEIQQICADLEVYRLAEVRDQRADTRSGEPPPDYALI